MGEQPDWVQKVGDAFLAQPEDVMDSVQRLRAQAQEAGNLKTNEQQKVVVAAGAGRSGSASRRSSIEPANPQVVYVPTYNPTVVYGLAVSVLSAVLLSAAADYYSGRRACGRHRVGVGIGVASAIAVGRLQLGRDDVNINVNRYNNINVNNRIERQRQHNWNHNAATTARRAVSRRRPDRQQLGKSVDGAATASSIAARRCATPARRSRERRRRRAQRASSPAGKRRVQTMDREAGSSGGQSRRRQQ